MSGSVAIKSFEDWLEFIKDESNSPEAAEAPTGVSAEIIKKAAHLYATGGKSAIYYGLGVSSTLRDQRW